MSEQIAPSVVMIDPAEAVIAPNVRLDASVDKAFLASIRERGVLVPVVGYRDQDGTFHVLMGQRRTLAAAQVKRETIPAFVVDSPAEADRLVDQLAENDHRAALTMTERVAAFAELAALGTSAAQIAKRTATKRADVDAAIAVAGSQFATETMVQVPELTLADAAILAEFEGDEDALGDLMQALEWGHTLDHTAQRLRDEREEARILDEVAEKLTADGVTVVDEVHYNDTTAKRVNSLRHGKKSITAEEHATCPGHAVYVAMHTDWATDEATGKQVRVRTPRAVAVCTDWKANGHTDPYARDGGPAKKKAEDMTDAEREQAKAERRDVIESNKAWDAAEVVRREWVKMFLTRKSAPKGSAALIATGIAASGWEYRADVTDHNVPGVAAAFGVEVSAEQIAKATEGRAQVIALGRVLAGYEARTSRNSWRSVNAGTATYLTFLAAHGYDLSDVEKRAAGIARKSRRTA